MLWNIIGSTAAMLTMFSFVPQIIKSLRTRSAKDLSIIMLLQLTSGAILWISYGFHLQDPIIITANIVTLITVIVLLALYARYGRGKRKG